jgi:NADH:ubiquinone oxidoreductase subunit E
MKNEKVRKSTAKGTYAMVNDYEKVKAIVDRYGGKHDSVIAILQDVQLEYHYLPEHALRAVAGQLGLPLIQICGVATFFKAFSLKPRGEHTVTVCLGTACHVRGAPAVLDEVKRQLGIEPDDTTDDMRFTLETVNCLGACALGPILVVDDEYQGQMSSRKVKKILNKYKKTPKDRRHEEIAVSS